jgi:hypothetical protein
MISIFTDPYEEDNMKKIIFTDNILLISTFTDDINIH